MVSCIWLSPVVAILGPQGFRLLQEHLLGRHIGRLVSGGHMGRVSAAHGQEIAPLPTSWGASENTRQYLRISSSFRVSFTNKFKHTWHIVRPVVYIQEMLFMFTIPFIIHSPLIWLDTDPTSNFFQRASLDACMEISIPFCGWTVFHLCICVSIHLLTNRPHFVYPVICRWTPGPFLCVLYLSPFNEKVNFSPWLSSLCLTAIHQARQSSQPPLGSEHGRLSRCRSGLMEMGQDCKCSELL